MTNDTVGVLPFDCPKYAEQQDELTYGHPNTNARGMASLLGATQPVRGLQGVSACRPLRIKAIARRREMR